MRQIAQAIIAGFRGVIINALFSILFDIVCKTSSTSGDQEFIYFQSNNRQYITKVDNKSHKLHANLFCTDQTQISSLFLINNLTIFQKIEKFGETNIFKIKSIQIVLISISGIWKFHLKITKKNENKLSTRVIHEAILISCSFTKPYLSSLWDIFSTNFQYIIKKLRDNIL